MNTPLRNFEALIMMLEILTSLTGIRRKNIWKGGCFRVKPIQYSIVSKPWYLLLAQNKLDGLKLSLG